MNLTVGPLPPAVYWRRRAIVLVGLLLGMLLIVHACGGSGTSKADGERNAAASQTQTSTPTQTPTVTPSLQPSALGPSPSPTISGSPSASTSPATVDGVPVCSDKDITVRVSIESTSATDTALVYGGTFLLKLQVRNVSKHACARDVGSEAERLVVYKGTLKIWSSDDCDLDSGARRHDVRVFQPNILIFAKLYWNTYLNTSISCAKGKTAAPRRSYTLTGRVGTAQSPPVAFTIT